MGLLDAINKPLYYKKKITFNYLYNAMDEYKVKSIMHIPIIGICYKTKISKKNKIRVTVCKIRWINPANGNIQCSYGNAMCNPNDTFKESIGQQIAESRAKQTIYHTYWNYITHIVKPIYDKFHSLVINEKKHEKDIINKLK